MLGISSAMFPVFLTVYLDQPMPLSPRLLSLLADVSMFWLKQNALWAWMLVFRQWTVTAERALVMRRRLHLLEVERNLLSSSLPVVSARGFASSADTERGWSCIEASYRSPARTQTFGRTPPPLLIITIFIHHHQHPIDMWQGGALWEVAQSHYRQAHVKKTKKKNPKTGHRYFYESLWVQAAFPLGRKASFPPLPGRLTWCWHWGTAASWTFAYSSWSCQIFWLPDRSTDQKSEPRACFCPLLSLCRQSLLPAEDRISSLLEYFLDGDCSPWHNFCSCCT